MVAACPTSASRAYEIAGDRPPVRQPLLDVAPTPGGPPPPPSHPNAPGVRPDHRQEPDRSTRVCPRLRGVAYLDSDPPSPSTRPGDLPQPSAPPRRAWHAHTRRARSGPSTNHSGMTSGQPAPRKPGHPTASTKPGAASHGLGLEETSGEDASGDRPHTPTRRARACWEHGRERHHLGRRRLLARRRLPVR